MAELINKIISETEQHMRLHDMLSDNDTTGMTTMALSLLKEHELERTGKYVIMKDDEKLKGRIIVEGPDEGVGDINISHYQVALKVGEVSVGYSINVEDLPTGNLPYVVCKATSVDTAGPKDYYVVKTQDNWKNLFLFDSNGDTLGISRDSFARQGSRFMIIKDEFEYKSIMLSLMLALIADY